MSKDDFKKFNRDALERYAGAGKTALRKAIVELREARLQLTAAIACAETAEADAERLAGASKAALWELDSHLKKGTAKPILEAALAAHDEMKGGNG
jgi:hypothetical protein